MKSYKLHLVGLQLLMLAYTAQPLVMLTANVEDIKKIARKVVSESLADKIAEFIALASKQMKNVDDNDDVIPDISADNNEYKLEGVGRNGPNKKPRTTRARLTTTKTTLPTKGGKDIKGSYEKLWKQVGAELTRPKRIEELFERKNERKKEYRPPQYHQYKQLSPLTELPRKKDFEEYMREVKDIIRDEPPAKSLHNEQISEKHNNYEQPKPTKRRKTKKSRQTVRNDHELNNNEAKIEILTRNTKNNVPTKWIGLRAGPQVVLTTVKQRTEFDQYFNPHYAKFIATSGPVMLPKIPNLNKENTFSGSTTNAANNSPIPGWTRF